MSSSTLIEVFGQIVFRFTRSITEHYNPEEPEYTPESFGYDPLECTGREWYYQPVDELIYQEYSDREVTSSFFLASNNINAKVINACLPDEYDGTEEDQNVEDKEMAWKRLRPSLLQTVCKSMYIGGLISFLAAVFISIFFLLISYVSYKTILHCQNYPKKLIPIGVQWMKTISDAISVVFYYLWLFATLLFLFRPYQLKGLRKKLILVCCVAYCLDIIYRVVLQVIGMPYYKSATALQIPIYSCLIISICLQVYFVGKHFCVRSSKKLLSLMCKMIAPFCLPLIFAMFFSDVVYETYVNETNEGKLVIALFSPLGRVAVKVVSRICVQRLWNISHPGYSYVLLAPLYFGSAVIFRVLQADLDNLQSIAILVIIHGVAEVVERSVMVVVDHIFHMLWKRKLAPWGSFRTPRRERLMADIAILSTLSESIAVVSVNGLLYLYEFVFLENSSVVKLVESFAIFTSVQLVIEWFFTSVSLAIETRYQNMAVMAVWRRRRKRHILVALLNIFPLAVWNSVCLLVVLRARYYNLIVKQPCKMPFT